MNPPELNEKLLMELGGWQALKHAKSIWESGRVYDASWDAPMLKGTVKEGLREYRAGLEIKTKIRTENLCTCRASKEYGTICPHSLAVGLSIIKGDPAAGKAEFSNNRNGSTKKPGNSIGGAGDELIFDAAKLPFTEDPNPTLELSVVLPPDFWAAWEKNQITLGLEIGEYTPPSEQNGSAARKGGTQMIDAVTSKPNAKENNKISAEDYKILRAWCEIVRETKPRGFSIVSKKQFVHILQAAKGHPRFLLGRTRPFKISSEPVRPELTAKYRTTGELELSLKLPSEEGKVLVTAESNWLLEPEKDGLRVTPFIAGLPAIYHSLYKETVTLPAGDSAIFLATEWPKLAQFFSLNFASSNGQTAPVVSSSSSPNNGTDINANPILSVEAPPATNLETPLFFLEIEGSLNELTAKLEAVYSERRFPITLQTNFSEAQGFSFQSGNWNREGTYRGRDFAAERAAWTKLVVSGFAGPNAQERYTLRGEEAILQFFASSLPKLKDQWDVKVGSRFERLTSEVEIVVPKIEVRPAGEDWFELDFSLITASGSQTFSASDIQRLLIMKRHSTRLRNGRLAAVPTDALEDFQTVLQECEPIQAKPGTFKIRKAHADYLDSAFAGFRAAEGGEKALAGWQSWRNKQRTFTEPPPVVFPMSIDSTLRDYQKHGVRWLAFLAENQLGGILADEMGLGKTIQVLAFITSVIHKNGIAENKNGAAKIAEGDGPKKKKRKTTLVICPTSLVENWHQECLKFTPELKALIISGPERHELFRELTSHDLVISSYALLRRDVDYYQDFEFTSVILDEAHHIKNPDSQNAMAACSLRSKYRFVLTGTPIENSVRDLWSIMHFLMPHYLGNRQDFRARYELPIMSGGSASLPALERLQRRMRAFLLRRRKKEVVKELPDKIEQIMYCELTPAQMTIYRQLLDGSRQQIDKALKSKNSGQGRMLVLTTLLRLRQTCCDLRLLGLDANGKKLPTPEEAEMLAAKAQLEGPKKAPKKSKNSDDNGDETSPSTSGKLTLLTELLEEIREGGHKVLIFSQFATMLKLLSQHLEKLDMKYTYLDGQTKERAQVVSTFQNDAAVTAFLISIKAGGVGLNLTAADTVIHFDPWWNPAVEAQATDRAHRIGQQKVVNVYKLITRGTLEEKILNLQKRKKEAAEAVLESDEAFIGSLSLEDMQSLLE